MRAVQRRVVHRAADAVRRSLPQFAVAAAVASTHLVDCEQPARATQQVGVAMAFEQCCAQGCRPVVEQVADPLVDEAQGAVGGPGVGSS